MKLQIFKNPLLVLMMVLWVYFSLSSSNQVVGQEPVADEAPTAIQQPQSSSDVEFIRHIAQRAIGQSGLPQFMPFDLRIEQIKIADEWGIIEVFPYKNTTGELLLTEPMYLIAHYENNEWKIILFNDPLWESWVEQVPNSLLTPKLKMLSSYYGQYSPDSVSAFTGFKLPWACGEDRELTRSILHGGDLYYAFDFGHNGTSFEFHAAKGGTVVDWKDSCVGSECTNYITIRHDDISPPIFSSYLHLAYGSIRDEIKGQVVEQGAPLAMTGNTGISYGIHLHFHVYTEPEWWVARDVIFDDVDSDGGRPRRYDNEGGSHYLDGVLSNWFRSGNCGNNCCCSSLIRQVDNDLNSDASFFGVFNASSPSPLPPTATPNSTILTPPLNSMPTSILESEATPLPISEQDSAVYEEIEAVRTPPASDNYKISRSVSGMGGGIRTSSHQVLYGTIGQVSGVAKRSSDHYLLQSGYWGKWMINNYKIYLPIVLK